MSIDIISKYNKMSKPAKASFWFMICNIVQKGIALLTTPIFTRIMTTEEYGVVSIYNSWLGIITIIATFELATGVFNKAMIKYEEDRDGYTSSTMCLALFISVIFMVVYCFNQNFWNRILGLNSEMMIMLFLEVIFSEFMAFWTVRRRFEYEYKSVVFLTLLANVLGTLLSVILVCTNHNTKSEYRVLGTVLVHIIVYSIVFCIILIRGRKIINIKYWKYAISYNLPLIPHYLSQQILNQSDRIMISRLVGDGAAAIYSVAYQLSIVMNIVLSAIYASFSPWAFQCLKNGEYKKIGDLTLKIQFIICLICFLFSLFAPECIYVLGGQQYLSAIWVIPPVTMSIVFNALYSFVGTVAFYYEKTIFVMIGTLFSALINIGLNYYYIPKFGFVAAGYTTLVCYILYSIVHYIFILYICRKNTIPNPFRTKETWLLSLSAVMLSFASTILYDNWKIRYFVIIILSIVIFINKKNILKVLKIKSQ